MSGRLKHVSKAALAAVLIAVLVFVFNPRSAYAATFGQTTDNANTQTFSALRMYVSTASPATSGTVTMGTCRNWVSATGSYNAVVVIYSDNGGTANGGTLLATSDTVAISNTTEQANNYAFSGANQITVTAGTSYWFGLYFTDPGTPNVVISRANVAGVVHFQGGGTFPTGVSPFVSAGTAAGPHDCYITYTETATSIPKTLSVSGGFVKQNGGMLQVR